MTLGRRLSLLPLGPIRAGPGVSQRRQSYGNNGAG